MHRPGTSLKESHTRAQVEIYASLGVFAAPESPTMASTLGTSASPIST